MTITINIPNAKLPKVLEALDYTPELGDQELFIKGNIKNFLKNAVITYETYKATQDVVTTDINIT